MFSKQLDNDEVPPPTAMAAVRDYTKTLADMAQHESDANSASVVDSWLAGMKGDE